MTADGLRDVPLILAPGETRTVPVPAGEVLYCAEAPAGITVAIHQQRLSMLPGDRLRLPSGYQAAQITNGYAGALHQVAQRVRLVVGRGDFTRQIIQGEVTVNPGITDGAGQLVPDARADLTLRMVLGPAEAVTEGQITDVMDFSETLWASDMAWDPLRRQLWVVKGSQSDWSRLNERGQVLWRGTPPEIPQGIACDGQYLYSFVQGVADPVISRAPVPPIGEPPQWSPWIDSGWGDHAGEFLAAGGGYIAAYDDATDQVRVWNRSGTLVATWDVNSSISYAGIAWHAGEWVLASGGTLRFYDGVGQLLRTVTQADVAVDGPVVSDGYRMLRAQNVGPALSASYIEPRSETVRYGDVAAADSTALGTIVMPDRRWRTRARLDTLGKAPQRVVGEVVRAALELHRRAYLTDDYLAQVYAVRWVDRGAPYILTAGSVPFSRAGVPDLAAVTLPGTITITQMQMTDGP